MMRRLLNLKSQRLESSEVAVGIIFKAHYFSLQSKISRPAFLLQAAEITISPRGKHGT